MEIADPGAWLPQQPPILMLDSANIEPGHSGTGRKRFGADDSWFRGHFPGEPILPGIYLVEALAQTAMLVLLTEKSETPATEKEPGYLAKIDRASFHQPVLPGADVAFEVEITRKVNRFIMVRGEAKQDETLICRCNLTLAMAEER